MPGIARDRDGDDRAVGNREQREVRGRDRRNRSANRARTDGVRKQACDLTSTAGHGRHVIPGLVRRDDAGKTLTAGPLDQDGVPDADAAFEMRPAQPVGERHVERRDRGRHAVGQLVDQRLRVEIDVLAVAAPQPGRDGQRTS